MGSSIRQPVRRKLGIQDFYFQDTTPQARIFDEGVQTCFQGYWKPITNESRRALAAVDRRSLNDGELGDFLLQYNKEIA